MDCRIKSGNDDNNGGMDPRCTPLTITTSGRAASAHANLWGAAAGASVAPMDAAETKPGERDGTDRYFVVVLARDADALRALQRFDLDVFPQTAKRRDEATDYAYSIDGLLSMAEIAEVVKEGYRVEIEDPAENRARGIDNVTEFPEWLREMQGIIRRERAAARKPRQRRNPGK